MEESTEPHMETDVSSTTEDVLETQEVTGSDGNVEMIIVVEKMEDETSIDDQNEEQPSIKDEDTNNVKLPEEKSPNNEAQILQSPAKTPNMSPTKSPIKSLTNSPNKSPTKPSIKSPPKEHTNSIIEENEVSNPTTEMAVVHMILETEPPVQSEVSPSVESKQEEYAVSSLKVTEPIQSEDKSKSEQKSPKNETQKTVQTCIKELKKQDTTQSTPSLESVITDKTSVNGKVQCNDSSKIDDLNSKTVTNIIPIDITIETSNDSQIESLSDVSEKEHKSISRELKSLIKSAKESKIINECTQLTSKTRKSRNGLDTSSSSLNSSLVEPNKIHNTRRNSDISQKSNCSEKSDKVVLKRSMRSQNPEFVNKVKQFLNSVTGKHKDTEEEEELVEEKVSKDKIALNESVAMGTPPKVKKTENNVPEKSGKLRSDSYCWRCHWVVEQVTNEKLHPPMHCTVCPRSFHYKCLTGNERNKINVEKNWVCPECLIVLQAESSETRSPAMKKISLGMLCDLLRHALDRMMDLNGVEPFMQPVDRTAFPDYDKYVVHPMDLSLMKDNIGEGLYGSTEAFLADAQWILHNSIIFNTLQSKLTAGARALVRSCRAEMGEIEACPECYAAAHARRPTWFTDVCTTPHILFWAKLKGFPYWPAKGMSVNSAGLVDVRFFGAHDRAWVPAKDCFLYSEKDPNNFRTKRQDIIDSMQEAEQHIRNISRKYGRFVYPPFKTQFDPSKMNEQLKMMIPTFEGEVRSLVKEKASAPAKEKSRSNSKSSKSSFNDGSLVTSGSDGSSDSDGEELQRLYDLLQNNSDVSDNEDIPAAARKMADGAEIAKIEEDDSTTDKDIMEVDTPPSKVKEDPKPSVPTNSSRKRRRSELEEAVITVIESSGNFNNLAGKEKRKRLEDNKDKDITENKKTDVTEPSCSNVDETPKAVELKDAIEVNKSKADQTPLKTKDAEVRDTENEKNQRVTPIRIALVTKDKRHVTRNSSSKEPTAKIITPHKDKDNDNTTPQRRKSLRCDREKEKTPSMKTEKLEHEKASSSKAEKAEKTSTPKANKVDKAPSDKPTKENRSRSEKRNSRSSRSTNSSSSTRSSDKEKRTEKNGEGSSSKDKNKESSSKDKEKGTEAEKFRIETPITPKPVIESNPKSVKDRLQFDDDTSLAEIARESGKNLISNNNTGLPTISCVRSLSTTAQNISGTTTITNVHTIDITEESTSDSCIFTPTSTETVITMKDAVSKIQKLRNEPEPLVGRVGVRAFARMTSPERQNRNDDVQVEIKAEPIDLDEPERHLEKMDLMNAFRLRPVNPQSQTSNLRDVRINKVVVTPMNARKGTVTKAVEIRPRAKKTFPQPKKDDGRSELNSKNSMVYIPIQPPMTQAPVRLPRPHTSSVLRAITPATNNVNNSVNTVTTPLMHVSSSSSSSTTVTTSTSSSVASVPTVHTVPLMTSVNGQWMFSFQPVMSVGAIDSASSPPILNGVGERQQPPSLVSIAPGASPATPTVGPVPPISVLSRSPAENAPGEPPRLQQRPSQFLLNPLDANTPIGTMPTPSTAGPVTAKLNQNAVKMTDFFRTLLEDSLEKLDEPVSQLTTVKLQLEQAMWRHKQELKEVKHNHELTMAEMRASFEKEKLRAVSEARRAAQVELEAAIKQTKAKQWCANCSQEAQFYCCWNTSYCDYPCQRAHWSQHFSQCQQRSQDGSNNGEPPSSPENRLQPQPDMPKNTLAPTLTVGGKIAPTRVYAQDSSNTQKASIIVSMVEDNSGNQTMKCVGTYKPVQSGTTQPIIINKQIMNSEENASKKVVSSTGGYLIVGASNNSSVVTPARRTHTIQYYS